jgi:hypothetical protein
MTMKYSLAGASALAAVVVSALVLPVALAAPATSQTASIGLTSTLDKGIVSIMTDPVLTDGRLILKVVAHNPTSEPLHLGAGDVRVLTAAGKPVSILSLDDLIAEAKGTGSGRKVAHESSSYSRPQTSTTRTGELDVTGMTGGSDVVGRAVTEGTSAAADASTNDPAVQQQIEALKAGILQTVTVEPGKAAGGQLVTGKIKFSRKEERVLRVVVGFNGEQHEFNFEAPPAK